MQTEAWSLTSDPRNDLPAPKSQEDVVGPDTAPPKTLELLIPEPEEGDPDPDEELQAISVSIYSNSFQDVLLGASQTPWDFSYDKDGALDGPSAPDQRVLPPWTPDFNGQGGTETVKSVDMMGGCQDVNMDEMRGDSESKKPFRSRGDTGQEVETEAAKRADGVEAALVEVEKKWDVLSESAANAEVARDPSESIEERIAQLDARRGALVCTLATLQEQHAASQQALKMQRERCEEIEAELGAARVTVARQHEESTRAKEEVETLRQSLRALEKECAQRSKAEAELRRLAHALELQNGELQKMIDGQEVRVIAHSQASESVESDLVAAEKKNQELRTALSGLSRENECVTRERAELEVEIASLRRENGRVRKALLEANAQLSSISSGPSKATVQLDGSRSRKEDLGTSLVLESRSAYIVDDHVKPSRAENQEVSKRVLDKSLVTAEALRTLSYRERVKMFEEQARASKEENKKDQELDHHSAWQRPPTSMQSLLQFMNQETGTLSAAAASPPLGPTSSSPAQVDVELVSSDLRDTLERVEVVSELPSRSAQGPRSQATYGLNQVDEDVSLPSTVPTAEEKVLQLLHSSEQSPGQSSAHGNSSVLVPFATEQTLKEEEKVEPLNKALLTLNMRAAAIKSEYEKLLPRGNKSIRGRARIKELEEEDVLVQREISKLKSQLRCSGAL